MRNLFRQLAVMTVLASFIWGCEQPKEKGPAESVTVQLKWVHQAQFAGFYLAKERGYYRDEHLEVTFLEGGKGVDPMEVLLSGGADFAVVSPEDLLIHRGRGVPVTAISVIYQRSAVVFVARADSGIERPLDIARKTVAVGGGKGAIRDFQGQFNALLKTARIDGSTIDRVPYDPDYKDFLKGLVDLTPAYITGGFIKLKNTGQAFNTIWPGDYGIRFYSDTIVTTDRLIQSHPERVTRFLRATLKGWREAVGDTDRAVSAIMTYARIKNRKLQTAMMEAQMPLVHTGEVPIGWMEEKKWRQMTRILQDEGVLLTPVSDEKEVCTMRFLEVIYHEDRK